MRVFLFILLLSMPYFVTAQDWLLGTSSNFTSEAQDVNLDSQGNSIVTGYISGHTNFKDSFLVANNGNSDIYVAKLSNLGEVIWMQKFGGTQADKGVKLAVDHQDNIIVTGSFFGNINFGSINLQSANNSKDIFLVKLNPQGDVVWARKEGGNQGENAYDVAVDEQNNVVLTGQFEGVSQIGSQTFTSQINSFTNNYSFDAFLAKYDSNGIPIWSKQANSDYEDRGMALTCDAQNNIYLTGQFSDTLNFLGTIVTNQIYNAGFVSKISPSGNVLFFNKFAGAMALPYDIELNSNNEILITGDFLGTLLYFDGDVISQLTNPYLRRIFLIKLTNSGDYIWGKANGSNAEVSSRALVVDALNNAYIGGYFSCTFNQYQDSSGTTGLWYSVGFKDVFVSKFSTNGQLIWNKQNGGKKEDLCYALDIQQADRPVYAGSYENNFIIPTLNASLALFDTLSVDQYWNTWPQPDGNEDPNFKYYLLVGDDTKNSFVGKVVDGTDPSYYYFRGNINQRNFVSPDLEPAVPLLQTCLKDSLYFNPNVDPEVGPAYDLTWNGQTDPDGNYYYNLTQDEQVQLVANRIDQCFSFTDQIQVQLFSQTPVTITDDHGFNTNQLPLYDTIFLCVPDSALVTPSNLCLSCTFEVRYPDTNTVFHQGMSPFYVKMGMKYFLRVYNQYGCIKQDTLHVIPYDNQPYDLIVPDLVLYDTIDYNDSIRICQGDTVLFFATDLNVNPNRDFGLTYFETWVQEDFTELNFNEPTYNWPPWEPFHSRKHWAYFMPDSTGWYLIRYDYMLGYANYCGVDLTPQTYIDSFYIEVIPNPDPEVLVFQDGPICPGEISSVYVEPPIFSFTWDGPGITWQSSDGDSIQVTTGGTYLYSGYLQNSNNGCRFYKEFEIEVIEKSPPPLFRNPFDGVICPDESVDIWITQDGSYNWYGVNGTILGNDSLINVENQGFYYCVFTDLEGCQMITQQVELREYTSPSLYVYPDAILCQNEEVTINSISYGVSSVNWISPIISSQSTIVVNQPGTYICEISQCGITVQDSVVIVDGTFNLQLISSSYYLCYGDTAVLSVSSDYSSYIWNDLFFDDNTIDVNYAGDFFVSATNDLGCTQTSNTVVINQFPESILPPIADSNICPGASIMLTHSSPYQLTWYQDPEATIPIIVGDTIYFNQVMEDTFVYVAYASTNCPLAVGTVMVNVIEPLTPPLLIGDSTICMGDSLYFETPTNDSLSYVWYLNDSLISTAYNTMNGDTMNIYADSGDVVILQVTDFCSTNMDSITISIIPKKSMSLNLDNELLCPQDPLLLYDIPDFVNGVLWVNGNQSSVSDSLLVYLVHLNQPYIIGFGIDEYGCYSTPDTAHFIIPNLTFLNIEQSALDCFSYEIDLNIQTDVSTYNWILPDQSQLFEQNIHIDAMNESYTGMYLAYAIDEEYGCEMYDTLFLVNHPLPEFEVGNDTSLCYFYSLSYQSPDLPYSFYWNGIKDSVFEINQSGSVIVEAVNEFGCIYEDSFYVYFSDCEPNNPNVFTPNGDGINDYFVIEDAGLLFNNCFIVLNRWGNVVYQDDYYQNTFNGYTNEGDKLNDGVYYYLFYTDCKDKNYPYYQGFLHILGSGK